MDAIDRLMNEHRQIERALVELEDVAEGLGRGDRNAGARLTHLVTFLSEFADTLHHGKEERLLFPKLCEYGLSEKAGPIAVMLSEHERGRKLLSAMRQFAGTVPGADDGTATELSRYAAQYAGLLRDHIRKEDEVLYVMARAMVPAAEMSRLSEGCSTFDDAHAEEVARLLALLENRND